MTGLLPGFEPTDAEYTASLDQKDRIERAIALLRKNEPTDGYYVAFSGGKDSCVIKELVRLAGVKFECWYNQTTIDPPEMVRFLKKHHPDVKWSISKYGNLISRVQYNGMPTRFARWCCREFKEGGGAGRTCVFGVRAAESHARKMRWREVSSTLHDRIAVCPIVYWTDAHVWEFIRSTGIPYCELYDEGMDRLGCVGCPLVNGTPRQKQFDRYPRFEANWKRACKKYWETHHTQVLKSGKLNFCSRFKTWEEMWDWWMSDSTPDVFREECQSGQLWTNQELDDLQSDEGN